MHVVKRLLGIKEYRVDKAQMDVTRARGELERADQALDDVRRTLEQHRQACEDRERALYAELCTRIVQLCDLNSAGLEVAGFKQSIEQHEQKVQEATETRADRAEGLTRARRSHGEAVRTKEKFDDLWRVERAEMDAQEALQEDRELEEVPLARPLDEEMES